jgi:hypothetical protein
MLLTLGLLLQLADSTPLYSGRDRQLDVTIPRFDAEVTIDGELGETPWLHAARLTGFSQYAPNDGVAAVDSTQVLVWYSHTAIYFGIRAFELHGQPTATLADRDQIFGDDNVQILLGTFHDGKQALMFAVNGLSGKCDQLWSPVSTLKVACPCWFANSRTPFCKLACDGLAWILVRSTRNELPRTRKLEALS